MRTDKNRQKSMRIHENELDSLKVNTNRRKLIIGYRWKPMRISDSRSTTWKSRKIHTDAHSHNPILASSLFICMSPRLPKTPKTRVLPKSNILVDIQEPRSAGTFRGHQAAKHMLQSSCPKSFQSFESQVDSQVFHSFPVLQSAISCLPVCY